MQCNATWKDLFADKSDFLESAKHLQDFYAYFSSKISEDRTRNPEGCESILDNIMDIFIITISSYFVFLVLLGGGGASNFWLVQHGLSFDRTFFSFRLNLPLKNMSVNSFAKLFAKTIQSQALGLDRLVREHSMQRWGGENQVKISFRIDPGCRYRVAHVERSWRWHNFRLQL